MGKPWVLDTETKGTGAEMVPLEKVLRKPAPEPERTSVLRRRTGPRPAPPPEPRQPASFKVVDLLTQEVLAEGADTRATVELLEGIRSVVDVRIYTWDVHAETWRLLPHGDHKLLWSFRRPGRGADGK
ncbi:MAG: hypothetical protein QOK04_795 [Solirubrobacteraceae bacterium]|jgi:hypothetical protein|nr:hypothetical protein [Solirubrobacteraceae bacterium]